jgi:hypothetical protein
MTVEYLKALLATAEEMLAMARALPARMWGLDIRIGSGVASYHALKSRRMPAPRWSACQKSKF